ncbi:MAG TPA: hypothetical protein VF939_23785 [Puia sp.]
MTIQKNRLSIFFLTIMISCHGVLQAQPTQFKKYTNQNYKFSFDIPTYWAMTYRKDEGGFICVPVTKSEKEEYKDCFEGIVFRMELFRINLDSTLVSEGMYTKDGDTYSTRDRTGDSVKAKNIKGSNWTGIYHDNVCEIICDSSRVSAVGGQCQFIYFSNGRVTVCIDTNGRGFDDGVLKRLLDSFRFHK